MKKIFIGVFASAVLLLSGCSKESEVTCKGKQGDMSLEIKLSHKNEEITKGKLHFTMLSPDGKPVQDGKKNKLDAEVEKNNGVKGIEGKISLSEDKLVLIYEASIDFEKLDIEEMNRANGFGTKFIAKLAQDRSVKKIIAGSEAEGHVCEK